MSIFLLQVHNYQYDASGQLIKDIDEDIEEIIREAFDVDGPSLIEVNSSLEYLAAYINISQIKKSRQ